ncbi:MAG TPA: YciI-like protein [Candidatus Limnocylindrales bacterium]|nr:YciI-like protein [Candidatus Limnocylindrales bacterium]
MAYYALFYEVVDDFPARRTPFREEHLKLAQEAHRRGEIVLAGALDEPADRALIILRGDSPEVARTFVQRDPYVSNGLVSRWEIRPWSVVIGGETPMPVRRALEEE